jgi:hypothetical protein
MSRGRTDRFDDSEGEILRLLFNKTVDHLYSYLTMLLLRVGECGWVERHSSIASRPPPSHLLPSHVPEYTEHAVLAAPSPPIKSLHLKHRSIALQPLVVALMVLLDGLLQPPGSVSTGTAAPCTSCGHIACKE